MALMSLTAFRPLFLKALQGPLTDVRVLDIRNQFVRLQSVVSQLQRLHLAELSHRLAVGADAGHDYIFRSAIAQTVVAAGNDETHDKALDVTVPRSGESLVKIVDGEVDLPLRGGESTKIARVPAALDVNPGGRSDAKSDAMVRAAPR